MEATLERPETQSDHCPLPMAPAGTCIPCCDNAREWWVMGTSGWYRVNADTGSCTCMGYQYRKDCRHGDDLGRVLQMQRELQQAAPITTARIQRQVTGKPVVPAIPELSQDELRAVFA